MSGESQSVPWLHSPPCPETLGLSSIPTTLAFPGAWTTMEGHILHHNRSARALHTAVTSTAVAQPPLFAPAERPEGRS